MTSLMTPPRPQLRILDNPPIIIRPPRQIRLNISEDLIIIPRVRRRHRRRHHFPDNIVERGTRTAAQDAIIRLHTYYSSFPDDGINRTLWDEIYDEYDIDRIQARLDINKTKELEPIINYCKETSTDTVIECCICFNEPTSKNQINTTLCGHHLCNQCLKKCNKKKINTCPVCRQRMEFVNNNNIII